VKEFWKSVKNWQSLVYYFLGHSVRSSVQFNIVVAVDGGLDVTWRPHEMECYEQQWTHVNTGRGSHSLAKKTPAIVILKHSLLQSVIWEHWHYYSQAGSTRTEWWTSTSIWFRPILDSLAVACSGPFSAVLGWTSFQFCGHPHSLWGGVNANVNMAIHGRGSNRVEILWTW